jgi:hypothetical protein
LGRKGGSTPGSCVTGFSVRADSAQMQQGRVRNLTRPCMLIKLAAYFFFFGDRIMII